MGFHKFLPLRLPLLRGQRIDPCLRIECVHDGIVAAVREVDHRVVLSALLPGIQRKNLVLHVLIETQVSVVLNFPVLVLPTIEGQAAHFRPFLIQEEQPSIVPVRPRNFLSVDERTRNFALSEMTSRSVPSGSTTLIRCTLTSSFLLGHSFAPPATQAIPSTPGVSSIGSSSSQICKSSTSIFPAPVPLKYAMSPPGRIKISDASSEIFSLRAIFMDSRSITYALPPRSSVTSQRPSGVGSDAYTEVGTSIQFAILFVAVSITAIRGAS